MNASFDVVIVGGGGAGLAAAIASVNIFLFSYCISGSRCLDGYTIVSLIC